MQADGLCSGLPCKWLSSSGKIDFLSQLFQASLIRTFMLYLCKFVTQPIIYKDMVMSKEIFFFCYV